MTSGNAKILVVDDNNFSRRMIVQLLQTAGFQTVEAEHGAAAMKILATTPDIRLISLDLEMPDMDGFQVLEALHAPEQAAKLATVNNDRVPVILVTANDTYANRQRGFELGAADFVRKDAVADQLVLTARLILAPATAFSGMTVLVADDSVVARHVVVGCVRQLGVTVLEAENGQVALDLLRAHPKDVAMVVTDMHMPEMEGDKLCLHIRQELGLKDLPIIVLSSTADHETKLRLFRVGATDYLEKPFIKEELTARLSVHLRRQQLDQNVRANIEQLKELDKLKDEFLAVCSHDLRSPLNGILGFAKLLGEEPALNAEQRDWTQKIQTSGEYLLNLINDLLDLGHAQAQTESMDFQSLAPAQLLRQCVGLFQPQADAKHIVLSLAVTPDAAPALIDGNHTALSRSFTNLVSNALKFTPTGGRVMLRANCDNVAREFCITCADTGIGIPSAMMSKLFSRYSKISRDGTDGERGTGLGLNITRELITAHGGRLDVESKEGQGTTFTIHLPLTAALLPAAATPSVPSPVLPAGALKLLVAEDNPVSLKLAQLLLQREGHTVQTAGNGHEAVAAWQTGKFDAIFMDVEMPEMDGRQATAAIRAEEQKRQQSPTLIIALTAHTNEAEQSRLLREGCDAILTKPIDADAIRATLQRFRTH